MNIHPYSAATKFERGAGGNFTKCPPAKLKQSAGYAFSAAHGVIAVDKDGIGIVDDAVEDGISQGGFTDFLVPAFGAELGAEDGGAGLVAGFNDF